MDSDKTKNEMLGKEFENKLIASFQNFSLKNLDEIHQMFRDLEKNKKIIVNEKSVLKGLIELYSKSENSRQKEEIINFISRFNDYTGPHETKPSISLFFPSEPNLGIFIKKLRTAKKFCYVCIYTLSNDEIAASLWYLHSKGVDVKIVSDNETTSHNGSDIFEMAEYGLNVRIDNNNESRIHHKFVVIDDELLINGSFNWTVQAYKSNYENMIISYEKKLVLDFKDEFYLIWNMNEKGAVKKGNKELAWNYKKYIKNLP